MLCALERGSKAKPEVLIVGDSMQVIATDSRSLISVLYIGQMHMFKFGFANGSWFCFTSLFFVFPVDVGGPADPIAPSIIVPPKNTSVTMGRNEAIMECVANARYRFNTGANGCTRIEPLSKRLPIVGHLHILWFKWNLKPFVWTWSKTILYISHFVPLYSSLWFKASFPLLRLSCTISVLNSNYYLLLSTIQRLNQEDRCIPLLHQCSVTLK